MTNVICFILIIFSLKAFSEYRVYQYLLKYKTSSMNRVISSLDPVSFKSFYATQQTLKVDLIRTWMCPGDTSHFKEYCSSPYEKLNSSKINGFLKL